MRFEDELPTVGILLCEDKNDAVVELTLPEDANIYASKYQLYLPSKEELAEQVARVRREIEGRGSGGDGQITTRKPPEKKGSSQNLTNRILTFLREHPSAGRREIAVTLGTTRSIVRYRLDKLRAAGRIERVGPDKGGYWRVLGESAVEPDAAPERDPRASR